MEAGLMSLVLSHVAETAADALAAQRLRCAAALTDYQLARASRDTVKKIGRAACHCGEAGTHRRPD